MKKRLKKGRMVEILGHRSVDPVVSVIKLADGEFACVIDPRKVHFTFAGRGFVVGRNVARTAG